MLIIMVQEHTPYSNSWQVKIHDLCKVSCICSSYAFSFIRPNELLNMWGNAKVWLYFIMHFPSLWNMICFEKHFLAVSEKQPIVFLKQPIVSPLANLDKAVMNSYAWLQLSIFFQNPLWVKYAFFVPLN